MKNEIWLGDCLDLMKNIPDKSIDLILTDPPYVVSGLRWDQPIDWAEFWKQAIRIGKDNCSYIMTSAQPFTTDLINSNRNLFKYSLVWEKSRASDFLRANYRPMAKHEDICVFSKASATPKAKNLMTYNPQGLIECNKTVNRKAGMGLAKDRKSQLGEYERKFTNYPTSILKFGSESKTIHPTQKPLSLWEYLMSTYSNECDLILDPFSGSGTTGVACKSLNRQFLLIEKEEKYYHIAKERLEKLR